jgi:PAS domain S-box-containing protein
MKALRPSLVYRVGTSAVFVAAVILLQLFVPGFPQFVALAPLVLLASFVGGKPVGFATLIATTLSATYSVLEDQAWVLRFLDAVGIACFVAGGLLSIAIVDLHEKAVTRFRRERARLEAALRAADAAVWERSPDGRLFWDENFYRLVGLDAQSSPPETRHFLAMVHPEDRERMAEARRLMDRGLEPRPSDEYRLIRPDGKTVWLENHRTRVSDGGDYYIGITQDITRRKIAEERVQSLLQEASHRARNQFAVIMAVAKETSQTVRSAAEFEAGFGVRLRALARSHDLLIQGDSKGASLRDLLFSHLEPFGAGARCQAEGPDVTASASATQYLGMAFHELATNAAKHGALASPRGTIRVTWEIRESTSAPSEFVLTWAETGGPPPHPGEATGFGTKVLARLVPAAFSGRSTRAMKPAGLVWTLVAPLSAIVEVAREKD